jgi:hypothetical protein
MGTWPSAGLVVEAGAADASVVAVLVGDVVACKDIELATLVASISVEATAEVLEGVVV